MSLECFFGWVGSWPRISRIIGSFPPSTFGDISTLRMLGGVVLVATWTKDNRSPCWSPNMKKLKSWLCKKPCNMEFLPERTLMRFQFFFVWGGGVTVRGLDLKW